MATTSREELRRKQLLTLADASTGVVSKVISPNPFQVGLDDPDFQSSLIVKGGITGSLTQVSEGIDFLQAGSNISVTKNSNGSLTVAATGFTNNPLTVAASAGTMFTSGDTTYDGSTAQRIEIDIYQSRGLSIHSSAGLRIDFTSASAASPATADRLLIGDAGSSFTAKYCTINEILALGTSTTLTNAITLGDGIVDSAGAAGSYNNTAAVTIAVDLASNSGLAFSSGELFVDPNSATETATVDNANDYVLIYDAGATATRKTKISNIAGTLANNLTVGDGLAPNGSTYNGSAGVTISANVDGPTLNSAASGLSVLKVPNALTGAKGIETLSFDGSGVKGIQVDLDSGGGLNFNASNEIHQDINNLPAGSTPVSNNELAVSFGANDTKKVDVATLKGVFTTGIVSNTVWVDGGQKAKTTGSISIDATNRYANAIGTDVFFYVSGTLAPYTSPKVSVFGGDTVVSGSLTSETGLSGSLTRLPDGTSYLKAGSNVTITSASNGSITIASSGGGGGGVTLTVVSGSTSVGTVDTIDVSKLGILQSLGSGDVAITGSIGLAEDGSYADGLFTDFTSTTPVGTAVDRFNEVLKGLAPPAAPALDDMDSDNTGANAKLSFGNAQSISGYTNTLPSTLSSPASNLSDVNINGTYSSTTVSNDIRSAVFNGATALTGTLNEDISADSPNYPANSFGNGNVGTLNIFVNNNSSAVHSVNLSAFSSGDSKNSNGSGFASLSAATDGAFSDGSAFSTFKHRTGLYVVGTADQRNGWNYARVTHVIGTSTTSVNYVEWVNDNNATSLGAAGEVLDTLSMTGIRKLSGAKYNTGGTASYRIRITNAYRNVYSTSNITFNGTNCSVSSQAFPAIDYAGGEDESKILHVTGSTTITADPILNAAITVSTNVPHPLKSNLSSVGVQTIGGILLYNLSNTSTVTSETFKAENYRLLSGSYNAQANVTDAANTWDSALHMSGSSTGQTDGLLFYNSRLYAPVQGGVSGDFRNAADGGSITNGPSTNVNYSGITSGRRTFYRYFQNNSGGSKTDFTLTIAGSGTIVSQGTSLSTGNISVLAKLPTTGDGFSTGWMDIAVAFATGQTGNGTGCLNGSFDSSLSATNTATFGTQSVGSNEYIVIKIEADAAFTGYISSMSVSWS
jgi:hypothetical protein